MWCEGLQVPAKAKIIKQWAISAKIRSRRGWGHTFLKESLGLLGLSLYPWILRRKQSFTPGNSPKFCYTPREFQSIQKPRPNFTWNFLYYPWNSNSFLLVPWNFQMLFLHSIPIKFHVLKPRCCFDLFWNSLVTKLCVVVLFSQRYY